jgi:hypothetical protein
MKSLLCSLFIFACLHQQVLAEMVGRTEFDLPSDDWSLLATNVDGEQRNSGAATQVFPFRAYRLLGGDGFVKAVLIVTRLDRTNVGQEFGWANTCPPSNQNTYSQDFGTGTSRRITQCVVTIQKFNPRAYFQRLPEIVAGLQASGTRMNGETLLLQTSYGTSNGAYLSVSLVTHASFTGLPTATPNDQTSSSVRAAHIAWGESLAKAVKDSLGGFGNKLVLPEIAFTTPSNAIATPPATSQKP